MDMYRYFLKYIVPVLFYVPVILFAFYLKTIKVSSEQAFMIELGIPLMVLAVIAFQIWRKKYKESIKDTSETNPAKAFAKSFATSYIERLVILVFAILVAITISFFSR